MSKVLINSKSSKTLKMLRGNKKFLAGVIILTSLIIFSIVGLIWTPYNPYYNGFGDNMPPSFVHWLGTTSYGSDVFSEVLYGSGPTLYLSFLSGAGILVLSLLVALYSGISTGKQKYIIETVMNAFILMPSLLIIILLGLYFLSKGSVFGDYGIVIALMLTGWAASARILRSQVLTLVKRDFILSSKLIGEKRTVIFSQITRNMLSIIASSFFFDVLFSLLALTWVEFYGLGAINSINWGTMLYWAIDYNSYAIGNWWWIMSPSIMIGLLALSFSLINFGVDEIANPKLRFSASAKPTDKSRTVKGELDQ
jgi:peptide/nickel transport system permease protein